jgi:predicted NUDIX family NTP pyrophosphohydrolase
LLLYRTVDGAPQVLLVHPGGPFWRRRDEGAWSIPKGEIEPGETLEGVARREFAEELGQPPPQGDLTPLGTVRQAGGKVVHAWASRGDLDVSHVSSSTFAMEWPAKSGRMQNFPEVDRAEWFGLAEARRKILVAQQTFIDRLEGLLAEHEQ